MEKAYVELSPLRRTMVIIGICSVGLCSWMTATSMAIALPGILEYYDFMKYQGTLLSLGTIITLPACFIGGRMGDRIGRKLQMSIFATIKFISLILCAIPTSGPVFFVCYLILQLSNSLMASFYLIANDISTSQNKTKLIGLLGTINGIAMVGGIFVGGLIVDYFGSFAIFKFYAITFIPGVVLIPIFFKNKKNVNKAPILQLKLLKLKPMLLTVVLYFMVPAFVYLTSTGLSLFGKLSLGLSSSVVGTLALPKNIIFIFLPAIFGRWMSRKLSAYGKLVYILGITVTIASFICCFWNENTSLIAIYLTMLLFGVGTSCQSVFVYAYFPFFVPPENVGAANTLLSISSTFSKYLYTEVYSIIYNRNYDAYTAEGGLGLGALVTKSFRGVCIVSVFTGIAMILARIFLYVSPEKSKEYLASQTSQTE